MPSQAEERHQAHEPVLVREVVYWLRPERGGAFIDCTVGLGGHAEALLAASPETVVIGIDRDSEALALAQKRLAVFESRFRAVHSGFEELDEILSRLKVAEVEGVLADLGVSSLQLDSSERGFSFLSDAPLDMRMDQTGATTAADLVNSLSERELADLIFEYGEDRGSRKIARAIIKQRERQPITTTAQLAAVVIRALNVPGRWRMHPATRTFQALRIAVNDELRAIGKLIPAAVAALARGGRLAIISFHSLEDRIVKRQFQLESGRCICQSDIKASVRQSRAQRWTQRPQTVATGQKNFESLDGDVVCAHCGARNRVSVLTRKPVYPSQQETERNPRSRSARLRVCEKI